MTQPTDRKTRRQMLAAIALAGHLPPPHSVIFYDWGLVLSVDSIADGVAWSTHLGGLADTYLNTNGRRYLSHGVIHWQGWRVSIEASEPIVDEPLDADTAAALANVDPSPAAAAAEVPDDPDDLNHDGHGNPVPVPQPGVFHGSMTPDPSAAAAAREVPAELAPRPMTGAEALDAAGSPEEFAGVLNAIFDSAAKMARDDADREDGAQ